MNWAILFTLSLTLFLAACQTPISTAFPQPTYLSTHTSTPTLSQLSTLPSVTYTQHPSPTKAPTSTRTPVPTESPFYTPTLAPTIQTAFSTLEAIVTQNPDLGWYADWNCAVFAAYSCPVPDLGLSPNGLWAAFFAFDKSPGLLITRIDGDKIWGIYFDEISGIDCSPCGEAFIWIEHWSLDGKYLYVSPLAGGDGGGNDRFWRNDIDLIRFDLDNGTWVDTGMGRGFSFSPNDQYIAYRVGNEARIREFKTGDEVVFPVPTSFAEFGRFIWSPDNKKLVFAASPTNLDIEEPSGFTVFLMDLEENTMKILIESDPRLLYPAEWREPEKILLNSWQDWQEQYLFDLATNELRVIEP